MGQVAVPRPVPARPPGAGGGSGRSGVSAVTGGVQEG